MIITTFVFTACVYIVLSLIMLRITLSEMIEIWKEGNKLVSFCFSLLSIGLLGVIAILTAGIFGIIQ